MAAGGRDFFAWLEWRCVHLLAPGFTLALEHSARISGRQTAAPVAYLQFVRG
jgi:hypothetical protein